MPIKEKKRIQVQVDKDLANDTEKILNELGMTPTTAITLLYKQIAADGAFPFRPALSASEKATLQFLKETEDTPVTTFTTDEEVQDWLDDPDED
ncbi:type II toxin-antitoxin system RelB/DinJ family antitoxin [Lactobacillus sp. ESL0791]|uniref:type II toxin-antitoxin system RelB/DinJ family antitoxin n=1 Tax=Lactobacillus sp. ESL0791 TaxID=2983234 RepID=UPI0023F64F70|nr:type II toxin-antitoxin system RelB/DinJ family antitoxin [Lactobacillus sp. ESL0791]MDF7638018.1 type II toxin-antitoxin system RelB/DinJ family antitoxin [Lactobacillus sp. ESL0791]